MIGEQISTLAARMWFSWWGIKAAGKRRWSVTYLPNGEDLGTRMDADNDIYRIINDLSQRSALSEHECEALAIELSAIRSDINVTIADLRERLDTALCALRKLGVEPRTEGIT